VDASGKITVAFEDDTKGTFSGDFDIFDRTSTDGVAFSDATNLSNTTDQSEISAQIIVSARGSMYFVWSDTSSANRPVTSVFFDAVP
jgi:hypothetical protein